MGIFNRIGILYREAGVSAVIRQALIALHIYENFQYYLYNEGLKLSGSESSYLPKMKVNNLTYKMLESKADLEGLISAGFIFKGQDVDYLRYVLGKGASGHFLFVGKEVASLCWTAMTGEAKKTFDSKPYKVDFGNREVCTGGNWTNPKFRNLGLSSYLVYMMHSYQMSIGKVTIRYMIEINNTPSIRSHQKLYTPTGHAPYARSHFIRILGFSFWKETPLTIADGSG